ncbi:MAG: SDR family oxidoreductase, partial [Phycisphaerales bacterium JB059]
GDSTSTRPFVDYIPYSIAKAGLRTMTVGLAKALAPEVRVNLIEPGPVMFPEGFPDAQKQDVLDATLLKRLVRVEDIVRAVIYLATARSVTGEFHAVDVGTIHRV